VTITLGSAWRQVRDQFAAAGIETASLDARLLAQRAFRLDAVELATRENDAAGKTGLERLDALVARRLAREPIARILGEKEFFGLSFTLSPATLVPRPETELVVELALDVLKDCTAPRFLDLGTGTGCIAIALLAHLPNTRAVAVDRSGDALDTARANAERHGVAERVAFRQGSWLDAVAKDEIFDAIVANPPYVAHAEIETLDLDVRDYDPHLALKGGDDGLEAFRVLARDTGQHLKPGGTVVVEHGTGQGNAVKSLFVRHGFVGVTGYKDLSDHDRALAALWPGESKIG
jgi:release factor glutamine methyltransferase